MALDMSKNERLCAIAIGAGGATRVRAFSASEEEHEHARRRYAPLYKDSSHAWIRCDPRRRVWHADTDTLTTSTTPRYTQENFEISTLPEDVMREIRDRTTTSVRFNAVAGTGVPGFPGPVELNSTALGRIRCELARKFACRFTAYRRAAATYWRSSVTDTAAPQP